MENATLAANNIVLAVYVELLSPVGCEGRILSTLITPTAYSIALYDSVIGLIVDPSFAPRPREPVTPQDYTIFRR